MPRPLLFVALTAALAAQERRPAFAHVVDAAGDPVAGAHLVAFASATLTGAEDGADRHAGIADPRGLTPGTEDSLVVR